MALRDLFPAGGGPTAGSADVGPPGRMLVMDDEPAIRHVVAGVLAGVGCTVDTAAGADDALRRLAGGGFDLFLVDLVLPGRRGLDLFDGMWAADDATVPVLLTGPRDVGAAVGGMKRVAFNYLANPAHPEAVWWRAARAAGVARARRRERELERVAAGWAATFDAHPAATLVVDPDGRVVRANAAAAALAEAAPGGLAGRPIDAVYSGGLGAAVRDGLRQLGADGPPTAQVFDTVLERHFQVTVAPVRGPGDGPAPAVVVARDVTELVRGAQDRANLLRRLVAAQEDERGRIAQELHDGIGQALVSLVVGLSGLLGDLPPGPVRDRTAVLGRVAADALGETRRLAHGLRPPGLDDLGLAPALRQLADDFTGIHGVRAALVLPADPGRLPTEVESAVFRIVQEALANVAKHSRAATVNVVLEAGGGWVRVSVADDGDGFPLDGGRPAGMGLCGMRERVAALGGELRVDSAPGRGTTLHVRIPLGDKP